MRAALVLFVFGLAVRLCFWFATADSGFAWHSGLQGDAPLWQELAHRSAHGLADEQWLLPLRPPLMQFLVASLWDGDAPTAWRLRLLFVLLGATLAPLAFLLLRRHVAATTAMLVGGMCAIASPLLLLSSGPHSELLYLVLVLVSWFDQERLRTHPTPWCSLRWGALHGVLCLLRAEHSLSFALFVLVLAWQRAPRWRVHAALAIAAAALALLPWHVIAWRQIDAYNSTSSSALPANVTARSLPWRTEALARVRELPAFQQGPVFAFVDDTVRLRGGTEVRAEDLDIVRAAYGAWPQALPKPFVCLYGGLNFFLANSPEAAGGFANTALDRAPPLTGGDHLYPPGLRAVLPHDGNLVLSYPPHLDLVVHGYRHGLAEMLAAPGAAITRIAHKLWHAAQGALPGFGGQALPIGLSGERRPVDLVCASGAWPTLYRALLLTFAAAGLWHLRRQPWLWPWFAFAVSKVVVVVLFFGYARQGALLVPLVALGLAVTLAQRAMLTRRRLLCAAILMLGLEAARTFTALVTIDGVPLQPGASMPNVDHGAHQVHYR